MKVVLLSFLIASVVAVAPALARVEVAKPAPDFSFTDTKGQAHTLSALKGKYVVLEWFNPSCPFVKKHYDSGNMQSLQKDYTAKGVVWVSVDSSAPGKQGQVTPDEANKWFADQGGAPSLVTLDPQGKIAKRYGAQTTPHMFVIDPKGTLIYQGAIDDKPSFDPDDIATARNYVRSALDEAMSGKPVSSPSTKSYGCSVKY